MTAKYVPVPLAILVALLFVALRAGCEYSMMKEHGPDPQMGIWFMFLAVRLLFWVVTGIVAVAFLAVALFKRWRPLIAYSLLLIWITAIGWSSARFYQARQALVAASATSTSPDRLSELARFGGIKAGYELDNRLAANPNTPPDTLRLLHGRPDQVGTEILLAQNPKTPDDILRTLAARNDEWAKYIADSLKRNPKYDEVFGDRN